MTKRTAPQILAVQMDPLERLNPKGDSTLALIKEALKRNWKTFVYQPEQLSLKTDPAANAVNVSAKGDWVTTSDGTITKTDSDEINLKEANLVLIRQDPPYSLMYITATHILEHLQPRTCVLNDPKAIRDAPEKLLVTHFPHLMPPTCITRDKTQALAFMKEHQNVVIKPLFGNGGKSVFKTSHDDPNKTAFLELFENLGTEPYILQRYLPNVIKGDRRIILINGEADVALNRIPGEGQIRSNLVLGGRGECVPLTKQEQEIVAIIGPILKQKRLYFAGIDVIDGLLTEINVTSPTGIPSLTALGGPDLAKKFFDDLEVL